MNRYTVTAILLCGVSFFTKDQEEASIMGAAIAFSILGIFNVWDRFTKK